MKKVKINKQPSMTKEEKKKQRKESKKYKKEARAIYLCDSLQAIGKIPANRVCALTLKPAEKVLNIHHEENDITLPYDCIKGFNVKNETPLAKAGREINWALFWGVVLFGVAVLSIVVFGSTVLGAVLFIIAIVIMGHKKKGATEVKWIATLFYVDKEGAEQKLCFIECGITGLYGGNSKSNIATTFESVVNNIASKHGEDIAEL